MNAFEAFLTPEVTGMAVAALVALSIGGVIYALFQPFLSDTRRRDKRLNGITERPQSYEQRKKVRDGDRRKRSVQDQLKEFEDRQKAMALKQKKISLNVRLEQAGLAWDRKHFIFFSIALGFVFGLVGLIASQNLMVALALAFVGGLGAPRWYVNRRRKRRFEKFLDELPNSIDIIVRGVKAGLPFGDCVKIVAREAREPVATEFRKIVETQVMGISMQDAVARLPERVPLPEANFFAIVVAIQQKAGGGLSEALGNLSKVLRGRMALKRKIKAFSAEAKSSAGIIGSLPFVVTGVIYLIAPDYVSLLFTRPSGQMIVVGGLVWMFIGIMVMRKMINFDF